MKAKSPTLPPTPAKTGPGRTIKRSGPVPAWGLKLGGVLATLGVFLGSFGYAGTHLYVTNAPLEPATVAVAITGTTAATAATTAAATATPSTATGTTTTLTSTVRTTTRTAVTKTASS